MKYLLYNKKNKMIIRIVSVKYLTLRRWIYIHIYLYISLIFSISIV
jgi:hypothetical protein